MKPQISFIYFQPNFGLYGLFRNFFGPYQILPLNYKFLSCTFDFLISILVVFRYTNLMIQNMLFIYSHHQMTCLSSSATDFIYYEICPKNHQIFGDFSFFPHKWDNWQSLKYSPEGFLFKVFFR